MRTRIINSYNTNPYITPHLSKVEDQDKVFELAKSTVEILNKRLIIVFDYNREGDEINTHAVEPHRIYLQNKTPVTKSVIQWTGWKLMSLYSNPTIQCIAVDWYQLDSLKLNSDDRHKTFHLHKIVWLRLLSIVDAEKLFGSMVSTNGTMNTFVPRDDFVRTQSDSFRKVLAQV